MKDMIQISNVSKMYRLGQVGATTLNDDLKRLWYKIKGKGDPFLKIDDENDKSKSEGEYVWALNDINLQVKKGEVVGIIGKNGAGKSTLLKLLSKVTKPTTGKIILYGKTVSLLEVGTGFHQELSGRENIYLNGAILGMNKNEINMKIDEIIDFSGCQKYIDTPVKRYSSGMFVRLAFAVAAHLEPDILIVDEVLAVGDAEFQKKAIGKMQNISKSRGRTVLFVSHNMSSIKALCSRVVLIDKGSIIADGKPNEIIDRYLNKNQEANYCKTWPKEKRPRNQDFEVSKIWLTDLNQNELNYITVDNDFLVNIKFNVIQNGCKVGLNVVIHDNDQNFLSSSINNHEKLYYGKKMSKGSYISNCQIPGKLFNAGTFYISVNMFGQNFSDTNFIYFPIKINLEEGVQVRGDYHGPYLGPLRPMFKWKTIEFK